MSADASPSRKERIFLLRRRKVWAIIVPYILLIFATLPLTRTFANFLEFNLETDVYRLVLNVVFIAAGAAVAIYALSLGVKKLLQAAIPLAIAGIWSLFLQAPVEKIHFVEYGLLGFLLLKTVPENNWRQWLAAAFFVATVGAVDEGIQWLLPDRVGDLRDVIINGASGALGLWLGKTFFWRPSPQSV